ncbi:MAG: nucleotidyltransferase [Chloroflexi bacterium]|nr:nucleotidyltransferase [Chloroflexota bacterium]
MEEMIRAVARDLQSLGVKYAVIGGIAASVWGRPRMTLDADIVIMVPTGKLSTLLETLSRSGFQVATTAMKKLLAMLPVKLSYTKGLSVDLRVASYSLDNQALDRAVTITLLGARLPVASKEAVIAYKVARFNDLDKADIKATITRWKKKLDMQYAVGACRQLAAETGDRRTLANLDTVLSWLA